MKENLLVYGSDQMLLFFGILCAIFMFFMIGFSIFYRRLKQYERLEKWRDLAFKDDLTGLMNRNAYQKKIKDWEKGNRESGWILIFDIDHFKMVNDVQGHHKGDEMLIAAAQRLTVVFHSHSVYRIGGDEFLVLIEGFKEQKVIDLLLQLQKLERHEQDFRFSKGYAKVDDTIPDGIHEAFCHADQMMYADKNSKKTSDSL